MRPDSDAVFWAYVMPGIVMMGCVVAGGLTVTFLLGPLPDHAVLTLLCFTLAGCVLGGLAYRRLNPYATSSM